VLFAPACRQPADEAAPFAPPFAQVEADDLHRDLETVDGTSWVRSYDPDRSAGGYNLLLYRRRVPAIFDMNGRLVHAWPMVRGTARARLDHEGRLSVIGTDHVIKEYDWDGALLWSFSLHGEDDLPHHDLIKLQSGAFLVLARNPDTHSDYLMEISRDGELRWQWRFIDHREMFASWDDGLPYPTHANSIHELPPNRWFASGDHRFRPGNILVSARNLSTIFIIDKASGEIVWQYSNELDHQHEATMIPLGQPADGSILFFDNGLTNRHRYRRSLVQAVDPQSGRVLWRYGSPFFFSSVEGTAQALPAGNIAITSSRGGRVLEITRDGDIVWEWAPSYPPIRTERLPYDHCPQLARLEPPVDRAVAAPVDLPYVDRELYQFSIKNERRTEVVAGAERDLVAEGDGCRSLLLPPGALIRVGFGIREDAAGPAAATARFQLTLHHDEGGERLVDSTLASSTGAWRTLRAIPLGRWGYQKVDICLSAQLIAGADDASSRLVWGTPVISSAPLRPNGPRNRERVTEQERRLRERQLEAIGYVE
jgi:outer membrane protein assembly factor BamB